MTEKDAQDMLLGKQLHEIWTPRIEAAIRAGATFHTFRGRVDFTCPRDTLGFVIFLPSSEKENV